LVSQNGIAPPLAPHFLRFGRVILFLVCSSLARDRNRMGPCEEPLLNELLNQMDGLKEDADILRQKLVQLYGKGLPLGDAVVDAAAQRTKGVSAAFIKELMRRIAQASIARDGGASVESADISEALDDMLFAGGKLNVKLLGGAQEMVDG
jgi:hypothetical protein